MRIVSAGGPTHACGVRARALCPEPAVACELCRERSFLTVFHTSFRQRFAAQGPRRADASFGALRASETGCCEGFSCSRW